MQNKKMKLLTVCMAFMLKRIRISLSSKKDDEDCSLGKLNKPKYLFQ